MDDEHVRVALRPRFSAAPVPTATTSTSCPVAFVKAGSSTSRSPESRIEVVVARIILSSSE